MGRRFSGLIYRLNLINKYCYKWEKINRDNCSNIEFSISCKNVSIFFDISRGAGAPRKLGSISMGMPILNYMESDLVSLP